MVDDRDDDEVVDLVDDYIGDDEVVDTVDDYNDVDVDEEDDIRKMLSSM